MSELVFKKLGVNPEHEAKLLYDLCSSDGIDDAIISEFPGTIAAYSHEPDEATISRIVTRYAGTNPQATGDIVVLDHVAIGLAYSGIADFQIQGDARPTSGINVSSWLSSHYRKRGIGGRMINHATHVAMDQSTNPLSSDWHDKKIWTSIKIGNLASIRACEATGFMPAGIMSDDSERIIYTFMS